MPSAFAALFAAAVPALDAVRGEPVTISPMIKPANGRAAIDPSRPPMTMVAIFDEPSRQMYPNAKGHASASSEQFGSSDPSVTYTTAALPYAVVLGDVVTRVGTGAVYTVSDPGDDGLVRTTLKLTGKRIA